MAVNADATASFIFSTKYSEGSSMEGPLLDNSLQGLSILIDSSEASRGSPVLLEPRRRSSKNVSDKCSSEDFFLTDSIVFFDGRDFDADSSEFGPTRNILLGFLSLEKGWDGYDGATPNVYNIVSAIRFLRLMEQNGNVLPKPTLSSEGEVGLYLENDSLFLQIGFEDGAVFFYAEGEGLGQLGGEDIEFGDAIPWQVDQIINRFYSASY